jgi:putative ABC transport system substrate-binding protein
LQTLPVPGPALFESAFATLERENAEALHVLGSILFSTHREQLTQLAAKYRLPAMYPQTAFVRAGGFVAYGPSFAEMEQYAAACVDKIIKGVMPQDIPVEQPTRFELVINLKTAAALGLTVPPALLARADGVIE